MKMNIDRYNKIVSFLCVICVILSANNKDSVFLRVTCLFAAAATAVGIVIKLHKRGNDNGNKKA